MSGRERNGGTEAAEFRADVLHGLAQDPKTLPSKWLYDAEGSRLFDAICGLDAYYPTRTEIAILEDHAERLAEVAPDGAALVELGSGSSVKTRILLDALPDLGAYVPVDISAEHLHDAAARIRRDYPLLPVHPLAADFTAAISPPPSLDGLPKLLFFPGSTIGNFEEDEARALLAKFRELPEVAGLVIGADLIKDVDRLIEAYDDPEGVTAAFDLNLLARINRELDGAFDLDAFAHEARWNAARSRIEMHLVSLREQTATVDGHAFAFAEGESIHTENSHKFSPEGFREMAEAAGWSCREVWTDPQDLFSIHVLRA
jgi:dimethylhistidine N-methyltransferase